MKKIYVAPVAVSVAFVVNENIATSDVSTKPDTTLTSLLTYNYQDASCSYTLNALGGLDVPYEVYKNLTTEDTAKNEEILRDFLEEMKAAADQYAPLG